MIKLKKISAYLFAISILLIFVATGCSNSSNVSKNSDDMKENVTLKWIMGGPGEQVDSENVWEEFNSKLKSQLPNTNVEFEVIPITDFAEKWKLLAASGEWVDIVWNGWVNPYYEEVTKGSYMELDELLNKNAPQLKKSLPDWVWEKATINGKIYSIPNYQMMANTPIGIRTFKGLSDKYFDWDEYNNIISKWESSGEVYLTKEVYDVFDKYLETLKEHGELRMGVSPFIANWLFGPKKTETIAANAYVSIYDKELKIKDRLDADTVAYDVFAEWYNKGYIRKDVLSVQDFRKEEGKENGYVLWAHNYFKGTAESESQKYGFPVQIIPVTTKFYLGSNASATNTAISRTSKNPIRAIKLLQLINTNEGKDLYNTLVYGLEGEHYKKLGDNRIETIGYSGNPTSDSKYGIQKWIVGNTFNAYETQTEFEGYNEYIMNEVNGKADISPIMGFKFDTNPIKVELAQYKAIEDEYKGLLTGAIPNYKGVIEERNRKFKIAGSDKIIQEAQRQLDEWKKNKK